MNSFDLKGRVAIITGGAGVLGSTIAKSLIKAGVKIGILGRTTEKLNKTVVELEAAGGEALALTADVLNQKELEAAREKVFEKWGALDILINAAGGNAPEATVGPDQHPFDLPI